MNFASDRRPHQSPSQVISESEYADALSAIERWEAAQPVPSPRDRLLRRVNAAALRAGVVALVATFGVAILALLVATLDASWRDTLASAELEDFPKLLSNIPVWLGVPPVTFIVALVARSVVTGLLNRRSAPVGAKPIWDRERLAGAIVVDDATAAAVAEAIVRPSPNPNGDRP